MSASKCCTLRKSAPFAVSIALWAVTCAAAGADTCSLVISGTEVISGACEVTGATSTHEDITFTNANVFAYIFVTSGIDDVPITARGYWNEWESHAHSDLGNLELHGECWRNENVELCRR
jgi:hypothetical protein